MQYLKETFLLIGACSALAACAAGYVEPSSASPHANFTFKKTISAGLLFGGEPTVVTYQTYLDHTCAQPVPIANFGAISSKEKTLRFDAGRPQRMVVNLVTKTGDFSGTSIARGPIEQHNCIGMARFMPRAGRTYELSVRTTEKVDVCVLNVIDTSTGKSPSDLVHTKQEICDD